MPHDTLREAIDEAREMLDDDGGVVQAFSSPVGGMRSDECTCDDIRDDAKVVFHVDAHHHNPPMRDMWSVCYACGLVSSHEGET